ncbi:hypothetical protein OC861_003443 [Tilletia horrida]|nr:hypothetical protein OC861_003443 [Tilletia horrida]
MDVPSSNGRLCTSTALAVFDNDFETPFSVASQTSIPLPDPATMQLESSKEGSLERQEFRPSEDTIMAPNGSVLGSKRSFNNMVTSGAPTATAEAPGETQSFSSSSSTTSSSRSFDVPSNSRTSSSGYYEARTLISGRSTAGEICELQNALRQMNRSESCKPPTFARTPRARAATFNHLNLHPRLPALAAAMKGWKRCAAPPPPSIDLDNSTSISSPATSPNMMKATLPGALSFQSNTAAAPPAAMRPAGSVRHAHTRARPLLLRHFLKEATLNEAAACKKAELSTLAK